jgi:monothiol glutaredoxin
MENNILSEQLRAEIAEEIKNNKVVIYMKGTLDEPRCGFSANSIKILKSYAQKYGFKIKAIDVLASPELREGIKIFSDWKTIPQIFINGEFQGGNDILTEMHEEGDLEELFDSFDERSDSEDIK